MPLNLLGFIIYLYIHKLRQTPLGVGSEWSAIYHDKDRHAPFLPNAYTGRNIGQHLVRNDNSMNYMVN